MGEYSKPIMINMYLLVSFGNACVVGVTISVLRAILARKGTLFILFLLFLLFSCDVSLIINSILLYESEKTANQKF
jgi:hypothetical protein